MKTRIGGMLLAAMGVVVLALPVAGEEFHPFTGAVRAPRVTLEGLPAGLAAAAPKEEALLSLDGASGGGSGAGSALSPYTPPKRSFARAAGEVVLLELLPWSVNRYLNKSQFAYISVDTVRNNLQTGFTYDRDSFHTDQSSHPFHGSLFFNAARSNGYSFWESGAFAFAGSFLWEMGMEAEPPAINDLVNTTLGGMDKGEVAYRVGRLLRDNTATGGSRFWRELGAAVLDPVGAFNRLLDGDLGRRFENPQDRFPTRLVADVEGFYRYRSGDIVGDENNSQGGAGVRLRYGDPFDGEHHKPYDYFDLSMDLMVPASAFVAGAESRGVLTDAEIDSSGEAKQRLGLFLHFNYFDNAPISLGAESFELTHLLLLPLGRGAELRTEAGVGFSPLAALQVDYERVAMAVFGRSFDYGPALSVMASARIRRREIDLVKVAYSLMWQSTLDGVGKHSRFHQLLVEGRAPLFADRLSLGAGWLWRDRMTTYDLFPTVEKSGSAVRLFAAVTFR